MKLVKKLIIFCIVAINIFVIPIYTLAQEATSSALPSGEPIATTSPTITETISPTPKNSLTPTLPPEIIPTLSITPLPLLLEPTVPVDSAILRSEPKVRLLNKKDYQANEKIELILENMDSNEIRLSLYDDHDKNVPFSFDEEKNNQLSTLKINPLSQFKMGKYRLEIVDINGKKTVQEFTWGVLAINPNKSIYLPNEQANLAMAVLDSQGRTVCNADTNLEIIDPNGVKTVLSTKEGTVKVNPDCAIYDVNAKPDYEASYQVKNVGIYNLVLTAVTKDGTRQITDSFEVKESVPFEIERIGPTRIYVPKQYHMGFNIKFNEDFSGDIIETIPNGFTAYPDNNLPFEQTKIISVDKSKKSSYSTINLSYPFEGERKTNLNFGKDLLDPFLQKKYEKFGLIGHDGVDFDTPEGTPILTADKGKVVLAEEDGDYGMTIVIHHSWGQSYYGHLSQIDASVGDQIERGQKIGLSGHTGLSTGPHLHFGIKLKNNNPKNGYYGKIDPFPFLGKKAEVSDFSTKQINWKVSAKAGEQKSFGYDFTAPGISPEFYLLGPLTFLSAIKPDVSSVSSPEATASAVINPSVLGTATDSAMLEATSSPQLSETINKVIQSSPLFTESRQWQIAADAVDTRVSSVEYLAGTYSGDGTTGQNSDTNQTFSQFDFKLAETGVTVKKAFIIFEAEFGAYTDPPTYTGWALSFDACQSSCTAAAWSGSGKVTVTDTTTLAYNETESIGVRLLLDVTSETTLAAYTGGGTTLSGQVGYSLNKGTAANSIALAKAKLVITYTYTNSSSNYTNTVIYPLESIAGGDQGTRGSSQAAACTKNTNCPLFNYNVALGEASVTGLSQWYQMDFFNKGNNTNDVVQNINIEGTDTDSSSMILEAANGATQGNGFQSFFSGVSGYADKTAQQLEVYHSASTIYVIGGETFRTYSAAASEATKTRTVRYSIGEIAPGGDTTKYSASTTVYLPEDGVTIKKAWFRVASSTDSSTGTTLSFTTTVGSNSESGAKSYSFSSGIAVPFGSFIIYHVIPSADYAELTAAGASTGKLVTVSSQSDNTAVRGVTGELLITYTYTGESSGYLSSNAIMAGQEVIAPNQSGSFSGVLGVLPETSGTKTIRGAFLNNSQLYSDSDEVAPAGPLNVGAFISTLSCSSSNTTTVNIDSIDSYNYWYKDVTASMFNTDGTSYTVCFTSDGGGDTDGSPGTKNNSILVYTYQVDIVAAAGPTLDQLMRHGKWFNSSGVRQPFTF